VGLVSTGDEIVEPTKTPGPGQIRDINSYSLSALIESEGGTATRYGIVPDDFDELVAAAQKAHRENEVLVISAGSSVSVRDMTADVVKRLGEPGVLVHGVALRPGKPTILALAGEKPVIGLPGNPVSAFVVARIFLVPLLRKFLGRSPVPVRPKMEARLTVNLASEAGREDYVAVRLSTGPDGMLAEPVFGKSNLIFTLVRADGLVRIPAEATGLEAGSTVLVEPF
jgi:molybdopterin molybdotransferase